MSESKAYDKLFYPGTGILKNKFNVTNADELKYREEKAVLGRMQLLSIKKNNINSHEFNLETLLKFHKYLFQDVYSWAGTLKVDSLYKGQDILNGQSVPYCPREYLEENLNSVFNKMKKYDWGNNSNKDKVIKFADIYQELWQCHPFNEGNTRTTSMFMKQFAEVKKIPIDFPKLFQDPKTLRNSFVYYATGCNDRPMNELFLDCMIKSNEKTDTISLVKNVMNFTRDKLFKGEIIDKTFDYKDKEYLIFDLAKIPGQHTADAIIQDCDSQKLFLEHNFAGSNPFKLDLKYQVNTKSFEKIQTKQNIMEK